MKKLNYGLLLAVLIASLPAVAQVYKWKDKDGVIRYSDTPPTNAKSESVGIKGKASTPAPTSGNAKSTDGKTDNKPTATDKEAGKTTQKGIPENGMTPEDKAAEQRRNAAEQEKKRKEQEAQIAQQKQANCQAAKANYQGYIQGGRTYKMNEKGEREYLNDDDLKRGAEKSQADINEYCN